MGAILNPIPYANLSFAEQNKVNSKRTLALLEFLRSELDTQGKDEILSQIVPIGKYGDLIVGRDNSYKESKHINQKLIQVPLKEINDKTALKASVILHKTGRSISGVQFNVKQDARKPSSETGQPLSDLPLFAMSKEHDTPSAKNKLLQYGISCKVADKILNEYNVDLIESNLDYCLNKNINSAGYVINAIKKNFSNFGIRAELPYKIENKVNNSDNLNKETGLNQPSEIPVTQEQQLLKQRLLNFGISSKKVCDIIRCFTASSIEANLFFIFCLTSFKKKDK